MMLESMMVVAEPGAGSAAPVRPTKACGSRAPATIISRAGWRWALPIGLIDAGHLSLTPDAGEVTEAVARFFAKLGIDLSSKSDRPFCRPCLDWSERRYHLAGTLGTRLMHHCLEAGWVRRKARKPRRRHHAARHAQVS